MKLNELTLKQAQVGLRDREFSCLELTEACLEAIEENKELNAFITVTDELAKQQAKNVDARHASDSELLPLTGIPFSVKDAICTKGVRSTGAASLLDNYIPPFDATTVSRILAQNGVLIGKTNCDAFGHGASNENSSFGPVKNPYDHTKVAGGSSGGAGAAVASHLGIYAIAEDTGGSVRCPAAFCGVVGLKVSYGRNSRYGAMPMGSSLDSIGVIGKSVYDVACVEQVIGGEDPFDATTSHSPVPDFIAALEEHGIDISKLSIGLPKEYFADGLDPEVAQAVMKVVDTVRHLGTNVREVSLPMTRYAVATYYIIVPSEDSANLARLDGMRYGVRHASSPSLYNTYAFSRRDGFPSEVKRRIMIGTYTLSSGYYDAYYLKAQKVRTLIRKDFEEVFKSVDLLLAPTQPTTAFGLGENVDDPLAMYLQDVYVIPASVAGIPAVSIPCGNDRSGLPIGLQLIAPFLQEEKLLCAAQQLEYIIQYQHAN